jgi:hypothetical protein
MGLFGLIEEEESEAGHSPIYQPKPGRAYLIELLNKSKTNRLIGEIRAANISEAEKEFLIIAATRHTVFNYEKIADYYPQASAEVQDLMEESALVIIDNNSRIQDEYAKLITNVKSLMENEIENEALANKNQ